jgi:hypothetical protein
MAEFDEEMEIWIFLYTNDSLNWRISDLPLWKESHSKETLGKVRWFPQWVNHDKPETENGIVSIQL